MPALAAVALVPLREGDTGRLGDTARPVEVARLLVVPYLQRKGRCLTHSHFGLRGHMGNSARGRTENPLGCTSKCRALTADVVTPSRNAPSILYFLLLLLLLLLLLPRLGVNEDLHHDEGTRSVHAWSSPQECHSLAAGGALHRAPAAADGLGGGGLQASGGACGC